MWEIWTNYLLPKAFKSCLKSHKWPDLVTLLLDQNTEKVDGCLNWTRIKYSGSKKNNVLAKSNLALLHHNFLPIARALITSKFSIFIF